MTKSASESSQNELEPVPGAGRTENRSQGRESAGMATVAQVRAALADVLDAGYQCGGGCDMKHPWTFPTERFFGDSEPTDADVELRGRFIDTVIQRLTELRERRLG